jgi:hypothetical protein
MEAYALESYWKSGLVIVEPARVRYSKRPYSLPFKLLYGEYLNKLQPGYLARLLYLDAGSPCKAKRKRRHKIKY